MFITSLLSFIIQEFFSIYSIWRDKDT